MFSLYWNRTRYAKLEHVSAFFILTAVVFSIVYGCGNLHATPRLVDENQIFYLDHGMSERGFLSVAKDHFLDRLLRMRRFLPVFIVHKLLEVALFGTNLFLWSVYTALLAVLTAFIIYISGRLLRLSYVESLFFTLIVVVGEQSVLWWRLFHGEGVGLFFVALAMLMAALYHRNPERRGCWCNAFCLFAVAASLSKESFILFLPAMVYAFVWLDRRRMGADWLRAIRHHRFLIGILGAVCLLELLIIKYGLQKTNFYYTGWRGYDALQLQHIFWQFFGGERALALHVPLVAVLCYMVHSWMSRSSARNVPKLLLGCVELVGLGVLVFAPQFLLYMSSGFSGGRADYSRFLIPSTLGLATIVIFPLAMTRWNEWRIKRRYRPQFRFMKNAVAITVLSVCLVSAYSVAYDGAMEYTKHAEELSSFYDMISDDTQRDSPIVVLFIEDNGFDIRRLTILMKLYLDRSNLYFLSCRTGSLENQKPFNYGWIAQDNVTDWVETRMITSIDEVEGVAKVVVTGASNFILPKLLKEESELLDQNKFRPFRSITGDYVCYTPVKRSISPGETTQEILNQK